MRRSSGAASRSRQTRGLDASLANASALAAAGSVPKCLNTSQQAMQVKTAMVAKAARKPTWSINRPEMKGPSALEAECPNAYQPKLRKRCLGDLPWVMAPTVCWLATDTALKPKPTSTAITNSAGTLSQSTGTAAPISTVSMPKRNTGSAPMRSTQRPTDIAASVGKTENAAMKMPTTHACEPVLRANSEPETRPPEKAMWPVRVTRVRGSNRGGKRLDTGPLSRHLARYRARAALLVNGHIGNQCLGHLDVASLGTNTLGIDLHLDRDRGVPDAHQFGEKGQDVTLSLIH